MKPTQAKLEYFDIMRGPWDRQDHQKPFAVDFEKPVGAGFYPEDLDEEKLKKYIDENPEDAAALNSLITMVDREAGGKLVATNYSQVSFFQDSDEMLRHKSSQNTNDLNWEIQIFRAHLEPAHQLMNQAAELTDNESLRKWVLKDIQNKQRYLQQAIKHTLEILWR